MNNKSTKDFQVLENNRRLMKDLRVPESYRKLHKVLQLNIAKDHQVQEKLLILLRVQLQSMDLDLKYRLLNHL